MVRMWSAFFADNAPENAAEYFVQISNPVHVAKDVFYVAQTALGDTVMVRLDFCRDTRCSAKQLLFT
jgi:hypothetical protein